MAVDLDTRLLRAFATVAEELNFTRAAERLFVAQQALSAQIQQLESRLGVKLFERTTRRVSLTEAGERLLPHALATLRALDAGTDAIEALRRSDRATLRVGLSGTAMVPLASETLRVFGERHPDVELKVSNSGLNEPTAGLKDGAVDVAFVRPPFLDDGISMVTVLTEERYAVLPRAHPLAAREHVRPEDVVREPWIWVEGGDPKARAWWSLQEFRAGDPLRGGTPVNSMEEAFGAVAAGLAITCQAASAVRAVGAGFPAARVRPAAWRADRAGRRGVAHGARDGAGARVCAGRARARRAARRLTTPAGRWPADRCFTSAPAGGTVGAMSTTTSQTTHRVEPYVAHQGEARWYGDGLFEFLIPVEATGGALSVLRATMPEGFSPPRHIHTREDEVFVVLDGDLCFEIDGRRLLAGPGTSVFMPRGVPHTFRVESASARVLGVMAPGQFEQLFRNLSVPAGARCLPEPGTVPLDIPAVMAEQARLGTEVVGPPLEPEGA